MTTADASSPGEAGAVLSNSPKPLELSLRKITGGLELTEFTNCPIPTGTFRMKFRNPDT
jgi:hypothetical protein